MSQQQKKRFRLDLEFDGTRNSGWQSQTDAESIQGSLKKAAEAVLGSKVDIQGCGRTDRGVHAMNYTAHLETAVTMSPAKLQKELNKTLSNDIAITKLRKAGDRFHARHNCIARSYVYRLNTVKSVFDRRYSWNQSGLTHIPEMEVAARLFVGMHDFTSFTDPRIVKKKSPMVNILHASISKDDDALLFRIIGSHFLWKMVRRCAGLLVAVGQGVHSAGEVELVLKNPGITELKALTAPGKGLFFEQAFYNDDELADALALHGETVK
jgi:tRNA pseudouridine38-40 synthase